MRAILSILLSLLLAGALAACAATPTSGDTASPAPTATPEAEQTAEPEQTPEPEESPELGVLHVSDGEAVSDVHVYHVADDAANPADTEEYRVVDMNELDSYSEFEDSYRDIPGMEDVTPRIVFMADAAVKDFRYLAVETVFVEESMGMVVGDVLYQLDELTPEEPFVVNWISIGDVGMYRGVSFVEDGTTRYFAFNISGYDGDMNMIEFKP